MKKRIIELINKIYVEQDKEKIYNLLLEFYPLLQENKEKVKEIILGMGKEYDKQNDKIGDILLCDNGWKNFKNKKLKMKSKEN